LRLRAPDSGRLAGAPAAPALALLALASTAQHPLQSIRGGRHPPLLAAGHLLVLVAHVEHGATELVQRPGHGRDLAAALLWPGLLLLLLRLAHELLQLQQAVCLLHLHLPGGRVAGDAQAPGQPAHLGALGGAVGQHQLLHLGLPEGQV
jgi:hypothetical protein